MKFIVVFILFLALITVGYQAYGAANNYFSLKSRFVDLKKTADELEIENKNLERNINYFANPYNLIKEARLRFNYRLPNENKRKLLTFSHSGSPPRGRVRRPASFAPEK